MGSENVKVLQDEIDDTLSIKHITGALRAKGEESNDVADKTLKKNNEDESHQLKEKPGQEYAVERLVDYTKTEE